MNQPNELFEEKQKKKIENAPLICFKVMYNINKYLSIVYTQIYSQSIDFIRRQTEERKMIGG